MSLSNLRDETPPPPPPDDNALPPPIPDDDGPTTTTPTLAPNASPPVETDSTGRPLTPSVPKSLRESAGGRKHSRSPAARKHKHGIDNENIYPVCFVIKDAFW